MLPFAVRHRGNGQINPRTRVLGEYWKKHVHGLLMQGVCYRWRATWLSEYVHMWMRTLHVVERKRRQTPKKTTKRRRYSQWQKRVLPSRYVCACTRKRVSSIWHVTPIEPIDQHDYDIEKTFAKLTCKHPTRGWKMYVCIRHLQQGV